ncbi:MAG: hypothetical protein R6U13_04130 [Desulfatiglandaceae bacterium]
MNVLKIFNQKGKTYMNLWILVLVVVAWFILQAVVLPKLGVST